jgi:hypothetical protein
MNQGKMRKLSANSFSNIQNSSQEATQVQKSKLDTRQVRNDLNYVITKPLDQATFTREPEQLPPPPPNLVDVMALKLS